MNAEAPSAPELCEKFLFVAPRGAGKLRPLSVSQMHRDRGEAPSAVALRLLVTFLSAFIGG
jgi:hypothetical protein